MARVTPRSRDEVDGLAGVFAAAEASMGFVPNSMLTMSHMPQLPLAFLMLTSVAFGGDLRALMDAFKDNVPDAGDAAQNLPPGLVQLIALATSVSSGCRYCQAHTSHNAHRIGESRDKLDDLLSYATSDEYSAAEKAVLDVAFSAGRVPNEATDAQFQALEEFYSDRQIVQIVAVIAIFGFLNRWNDTMATTLEENPVAFAREALSSLDWQVGKHGINGEQQG